MMSKSVITPKEAPAPLIAQNKSEFWVAVARTIDPLPVITVAPTTWSRAAPHIRDAGPSPPIVACPPTGRKVSEKF